MHEHSSNMVRPTRHSAAFRLRQLLDELHLLMAAFPDLHDAFDADELPLAFILRRDSQPIEADAMPRRRFPARAQKPARRRTRSTGTHNRSGRRKQLSDE